MKIPPTTEPELGDSDFRVVLDQAGRGPGDHPAHPEIALLSADFYVAPDDLYRWMRANAPVYWDDKTGRGSVRAKARAPSLPCRA